MLILRILKTLHIYRTFLNHELVRNQMWNWNLGWIMELVETRCGIMREPRIDLELGVWLEGMWYWDIFYFVLGRNMEEGRNILGMELCRTRMWKEPRSNGKGGSYLKKLGWTLQETEREVLRTRKLGPQIILARIIWTGNNPRIHSKIFHQSSFTVSSYILPGSLQLPQISLPYPRSPLVKVPTPHSLQYFQKTHCRIQIHFSFQKRIKKSFPKRYLHPPGVNTLKTNDPL